MGVDEVPLGAVLRPSRPTLQRAVQRDLLPGDRAGLREG